MRAILRFLVSAAEWSLWIVGSAMTVGYWLLELGVSTLEHGLGRLAQKLNEPR